MVTILECCSAKMKEKPKAAVLSEALNCVRLGATQQHELSAAFLQFGLGKALLKYCDDVVARSADDIIGDGAFEAAQEPLEIETWWPSRRLWHGAAGPIVQNASNQR